MDSDKLGSPRVAGLISKSKEDLERSKRPPEEGGRNVVKTVRMADDQGVRWEEIERDHPGFLDFVGPDGQVRERILQRRDGLKTTTYKSARAMNFGSYFLPGNPHEFQRHNPVNKRDPRGGEDVMSVIDWFDKDVPIKKIDK